jgi:hypothetical protein
MTPNNRIQQRLSSADAERTTTLMRDGCAHHAAGRIADAAILYLKALTIDGENDGARRLFGVAAAQLGLSVAER